MIRPVALLSACLALAACGDILTTPYAYGEVEVRATRASGEPIPDVQLLLYSGTRQFAVVSTDLDGDARFAFVPQGPLGVSARPPMGYRAREEETGYFTTFRMSEGGRHTTSFEFVGPGSIRVSAEDASGASVVGFRVEVYTVDGTVAAQLQERAEPLLFEKLAYGDYGVRAVSWSDCSFPEDEVFFSDGHWVDEDVRVEVTLVVGECS